MSIYIHIYIHISTMWILSAAGLRHPKLSVGEWIRWITYLYSSAQNSLETAWGPKWLVCQWFCVTGHSKLGEGHPEGYFGTTVEWCTPKQCGHKSIYHILRGFFFATRLLFTCIDISIIVKQRKDTIRQNTLLKVYLTNSSPKMGFCQIGHCIVRLFSVWALLDI